MTQIENLVSWCSNLMCSDTISAISFLMLTIWFYRKNDWYIKILLCLPRYLGCLFGLQNLSKLTPLVTKWVTACLQSSSKQSTAIYDAWNFSDCFRQSVTKIMRKTAISTTFLFLPPSPVNNVESQRTNLVSSCYRLGTL